MDKHEYVLAGDVGGTNLRIAAIDPSGKTLHLSESATPASQPASEVTAAIVAGASACVEQVGGGGPIAFCLALPALVNSHSGRVLRSPNLPQLNNTTLAADVCDLIGVPTVLENDATAAAIGEYWLGSTSTAENSIFVTLGTGIGGGLILGRKPYRGVDGTAGEIGHICVVPDGIPCGCGSYGCVEQYASARAIARIANELAAGSAKRYKDSKQVFEAAVDNDEVAVEAFRQMGQYLGMALASLVNVLNPELIAIGGGAAGGWDFFVENVTSTIRKHAFAPPAERVRVVRASLGSSAGILGAGRVAFDSVS